MFVQLSVCGAKLYCVSHFISGSIIQTLSSVYLINRQLKVPINISVQFELYVENEGGTGAGKVEVAEK